MWSSLLRWSLAQGGDGTTSSPQGPMSDEKREFLEAALKSLGADAAERQKAIFEAIGKYVEAPSEELVDKCAEALEALEDDVIDLDAARDLLKLGCFGLVLKSVSAEHGEVSGAACAVVAAAAQNDPEVQTGMGAPALESLFGAYAVALEREDDGWCRKVLNGMSSLSRGCTALEQTFVGRAGMDVLAPALGRAHTSPGGARLAARAAFVLKALLDDDASRAEALRPALDAALAALGVQTTPVLDPSVNAARSQLHEHATAALIRAKTSKDALKRVVIVAKLALADPNYDKDEDPEGRNDQLKLFQ